MPRKVKRRAPSPLRHLPAAIAVVAALALFLGATQWSPVAGVGAAVDCLQRHGTSAYTLQSALAQLVGARRTIGYNYARRAEIEEFLDENRALQAPADTALWANRGKNLVVIAVDGLDAQTALDSVNGLLVMPTLASLIAAKGTITAPHTVVQSSAGDDALVVVNCGLLPLPGGATSKAYGARHQWPRLPQLLPGRRSSADFSTARAADPRIAMGRAVGYDSVFGLEDLQARGLAPTALLELAAQHVRRMPQPFVAYVTVPRPDPEAVSHAIPEADLAGIVGERRERVLSARAFDRALADLIASLKRHGLNDRTVIAIVPGNLPAVGAEGVAVITGTGTTALVDKPIGQIDLFPTLLDVMGSDATWRGLGLSVFNPRAGGAVDRYSAVHGHTARGLEQYMRRAWNVSYLMIRGDWFNLNEGR